MFCVNTLTSGKCSTKASGTIWVVVCPYVKGTENQARGHLTLQEEFFMILGKNDKDSSAVLSFTSDLLNFFMRVYRNLF